MIEIAIALGVIAFALVAIVGVLPMGMNVQRDNRAETIINHDASYWMEALRGLSVPTNSAPTTGTFPGVGVIPLEGIGGGLDDLVNYVDGVTVQTTFENGGPNVPDRMFTNSFLASGGNAFSTGREILGLLSTPGLGTNTAIVRTLSGAATEKATRPDKWSGQEIAMRYKLSARIVPVNAVNAGTTLDFDTATGPPSNVRLESTLYDIELKFSWPVVGKSSGTRSRVYRSMASRYLNTNANISATSPANWIYYFLAP